VLRRLQVLLCHPQWLRLLLSVRAIVPHVRGADASAHNKECMEAVCKHVIVNKKH
jgi:hypothetical protein